MATNSATVTVSVNSPLVDLNAPVILSSSLSGSLGRPTGKVTFLAGSVTLGSATVDADGLARWTTSTLAAGTYSITASYSGDTTYGAGVSSATALLVGAAAALTDDTTIPELSRLQLLNNGATLELQFSQQLGSPQTPPAASAFVVEADGAALTVNSVAVSGNTASLVLATPVTSTTKQVTVRYTDPTTGDDAGALKYLTGQDVTDFTGVLGNQAPVLTYSATPSTYTENAAAVKVFSTAKPPLLSDADSTSLQSARVEISSGLTTGDLLEVTTTSTPLTASYANGVLTVVGSADAATYLKVLSSLTFKNTTIAPTAVSNQRSLAITLRDTGGSGLAPQTSTPVLVTMNVLGVNSAQPVLDAAKINRSTAVKLGSPAPANGTLPVGAFKVSDLVQLGSAAGQNVVDADLGPLGIALTAVDTKVDPWYSTDGGGTWQAVGTVSATSARVLFADGGTWVYLQPKTSVTAATTVAKALTFRAWDRNTPSTSATPYSNGQGGIKTDLASTATAPSPFSSATDTVELVVAANQRPLLNATSALLLSPVPALDAQPQAEDIGKSTLVRDLIGSSITDPDAGDPRGIAITGVAPGLELYTSTDNGTRWTKAPGLTVASALTLLANDNTRVLLVDPTEMNTTRTVSSALTLVAWDGSGGHTNGKTGVSTTANTTAASPFSSNSRSADLLLQKLNTAPNSNLPSGFALFDSNYSRKNVATSVVTQAGGKILIAGYTGAQPAGATGSFTNYGVARLNADGSRDTSFGTNGQALLDLGSDSSDSAYSMLAQADGKILLAGSTSAQPAGVTGSSLNYGVVRLNADGSRDASFGTNGQTLLELGSNSSDSARSVVTQTDGKILIAGITNALLAGVKILSANYGVVRLNADGSRDTSFGTNGQTVLDLGSNTIDEAYSMVTQADGKILIAGSTHARPAGATVGQPNYNYGVVRLNANGSLDTSFGTNGQALLDLGSDSSDSAYSMVTQADGKILIAGTTDAQPAGGTGKSTNYGVVRLNANGSLDTSFGTNGQTLLDLGSNTGDDARSIVAQADGKILIAGFTTALPAGARLRSTNYGVVRLNANGNLDTNFGTNGQTLLDLVYQLNYGDDAAYSMVTQSDGKILIAGVSKVTFEKYGVVRLNADGTLDTAFAPVSSLDGKVNYVIGAPAVRLDNDVRLNDPDLATLNSGAGNYAGTRLVLQRDGGASANDRFAGLRNLQLEAPAAAGQPGRVLLGSTTLNATAVEFGSYTQSGGKLEMLFNNNTTQAVLNEAASSLGYAFTGEIAPGGPIQISWQFFDGNAGEQGLGKEVGISGTTQVTVAAPPVDRTSSATLLGTTAVSLPATASSAATAATVLELRLTDNDANSDGVPNGGTSDGQPTQVRAISVSLTTPGTAALSYQLRGPDLVTPVAGVLSSDGTTLSFDLGANPLSIANNSSETYSIEAWYNGGSVTDGANLVALSLDPLKQLSLAPTGSLLNANTPVQKQQVTADVVATTLNVLAPATKVVSGKAMTFTVQAVDANGNLDKQATGTVTLELASGNGTLQQVGTTGNPTATYSNGVAYFDNVVYAAAEDGESFTLKATGGVSGVSSAIVADVRATTLQFQGQPTPGKLLSGAASTLSGLSLVGLDAEGRVDKDLLAANGQVQLSLQTAGGSLTSLGRASGDTDSNPLTLTLNAGAIDANGRIDLGTLQLGYTNASGSNEDTLALKADLLGGTLPTALGPNFSSIASVTSNTPPSLGLGNATAPAWSENGGVANAAGGTGPVAVAPGAVLGDTEQTTLQSLTVALTNLQAGDVLALPTQVATSTGLRAGYDASSGVLKIVGQATLADYQTALRAVTFTNTSDDPDTTTRNLTVTAHDGQSENALSSLSLSLTVAAANDKPFLNGITAINATEDTPAALDLSGFTFGDFDSGATPISLTLTAVQGALNAKDGAGVTVAQGGNPGELVLQGTAEKINAFVLTPGTIQYAPASQTHGVVALSFSADDGTGAVSLGSTTISVAAVNDEAVFSGVPSNGTVARLRTGVATTLQSLLGSATPVSLADSDLADYSQNGRTQLTFTAANSTLGGVSSGVHSGGASLSITNASTWVASGTPGQLNSLLADPALTVRATAAGAASLTLSLNDGSNSAGSSSSAALAFQSSSDPVVNNSASSSGNALPLTTHLEESLGFLTLTDPDAGTNAQVFTLTVSDPSNGFSLFGLKDRDLGTGGLQLEGTAAEINAALAAGRFKALADGTATLELSLSNGLAPAVTSTVYVNASNAAPTLTQVNALVGATEDVAYAVTFAQLQEAGNALDAGGSVTGFQVTSVDSTKGSLSIGGNPWNASTNNRIDADTAAVWTPAADLNGTGAYALAAFEVKALDDGGLSSATALSVKINVAAVNDAPVLTGVPGSSVAILTGQSTALADFTVSDVDNSTLSVTLSAKNGTLGNLTDADSNQSGIQLNGSASAINTALAGATFTAATNGGANFLITVEDGSPNLTVGKYGFSATTANSAPSLSNQGTPRAVTTGLGDSLGYITVSDADAGQNLTLTLTPSGGSLKGLNDADPNVAGIQVSGTVSDLNAALAAATFVAGVDGAASISVSAADGVASAVTNTYNLTATNAAPTLTQLGTLSGGTEDLTKKITFAELQGASDASDTGGSVTGFQVTSVDSTKGSLSIGGTPWNASTNNRIDADTVAEWTPAADLNGTGTDAIAAFAVKALDDGGLSSATALSVKLNVAAVNDAPTLSGSYAFAGTTEDAPTTAVRVASLLNGSSPTRSATDKTDETTSAALGLALTGSTGIGSWQFSTDATLSGSTVWQSVGSVSDQNALLLGPDTWVRYQPDATNTPASGETAIGITYRSWDTSEGAAGSRVDASINGNASAFSSTALTATLNVGAVDDPLTLNLSLATTTTNNVTAAALPYQELDANANGANDDLVLDASLTLLDPDTAQTRTGAKVLINSGFQSAEDRLFVLNPTTVTTTNGTPTAGTVVISGATITFNYDVSTGVLALSSSAVSLSIYEEALRRVTYRNISDTPTAGVREVEMLADNMFVRRDGNGLPHFYEYVSDSTISWTSAKTAAENRYYAGMQGYLATITSAAENEFLKTRMPSNAWIGASDAASEGTWKWVTGPEAGQTFWSGSSSGSAVNGAYANWQSSQPNNTNGGQDYGEILPTDGEWNDRSNTEYPDGYLVEYSSTNVSDISFSKTFNITVQPGNDAPVLSSATPTLTSLNEDATQNGGQLISSIVNSSTITDVDSGAVRGGIAISALNSGNGSWEYRLNNTGSWVAMGAISSTSALLLRPADAVRFVPDDRNGTAASFTYRAWDQSSGTAGTTADTTNTGGSAAFSSTSNTASITVTSVNDAPVFTQASATDKSLGTVSGGDSADTGYLVSALIGDAVDPDSGAAALGAALVSAVDTITAGNTDIGNWEVSTNSGSSWSALTGINSTAARLLAATDRIRFTPSGAVGGQVSVALKLWDRTSGSAGTTVNPGSGGGTSSYSADSRTFTLKSTGISLSGANNSVTLSESQTLNPGSTLALTSGTLSSARVQVASGFTPGDVLSYTPPGGSAITASYDATAGVLTLSGSASSSDYETALRAVQFSVGEDPTQFSAKRQIAYLLDSQTTATAFTTVTVTAEADAPSLSSGPTVSYTEGGSGVAIHPTLVLADLDDLKIASVTVTIFAGRLLTDRLQLGSSLGTSSPITATTYSSSTGVLRLSGTASVADYELALRSVTYRNTGTNPTDSGAALSRSIRVSVTDANSDGFGSAAAGDTTVNVTINAVNVAPVLTAGGQLSYTEGGAAAVLDAGITISDADDTQLTGAVLEISSGYTAGDQLALASQNGITGSFDAATGTLTLTGTATVAQYQTALRTVTFSSASGDPTASQDSRTVSIQVTDANRDAAPGGAATSTLASSTITLTPTVDAPVVSVSNATTPSYTEAGAPVALSPNLILSDADDTQISKAVVSISSGLSSGDLLGFTPVNGISGKFDEATGRLTFTGAASLGDYQTLLRSVAFSSSSSTLPNTGSRTIGIQVLDANSDGLTPQWSTVATAALDVLGVNQAPLLSSVTGVGSYTENDPETQANAQLTLSDGDSSQLSGATVTISTGLTLGDLLALPASVATSTGITASYNSGKGVLTLSGDASLGNYQKALRAVTFSSSSDTPTATSASRTLSWRVTDKDATTPVTSTVFTSTLTLTGVNDTPTLTDFAGTLASGGEDTEITLTYADLIGNTGNKAQVADADGTVTSLMVDKVLSGSLRLGSSAATATAFDPGSNAVLTAGTNAYWTPAANANGPALDAFAVVARDSGALVSIHPRSVQVDVSPDHADAASISGVALPANGTYVPGQALDFTVSFDRAVTVDTANGTPSLPLSLDSGGALAAAYRSGSGTDTLTFRYTVGVGDLDLDGLSLGSALSLNNGTITSIDDSQPVNAGLTLPGIGSTAGLRVDGVNQAPLISSATGTGSYGENDPEAQASAQIALSDGDSTELSGATVTISAGLTAGDILALPAAVATSTGITASYNSSTGVLTLSGDATVGDYQQALRAVTFSSSSDTPTSTSASRTLSWQVTDKDGTAPAASAVVTSTLTLSAVNDNPTLTGFSAPVAAGAEDSAVEISLAALLAAGNEDDVDGQVTAFVVQAVTTGSLRLGGTAATATDWAVGSNDVIDGNTKAFWTPAADASGSGANALPALSLLARDNAGALSANPVTVKVNVTPVGDAARITSLNLPGNGTYAAGDTLKFTIVLDRDVTLDASGGKPKLTLALNSGASAPAELLAPKTSYTAGEILTFAYTVQTGDLSPAGLSLPASLDLPAGSSLTNTDDGFTVPVDLSLPQPNSSGVQIDGISPTLFSIEAAPGNLPNGETQSFRVTFSEPVRNVDASQFKLVPSGTASGRVSGVQAVNPVNGSAASYDLLVADIAGAGILRFELRSSGSAIRDAHGNPFAAGSNDGRDLAVDREAPPAPAIGSVGSNDLLSYSGATDSGGVRIKGTATGVEAGQILTLTVSGSTVSTTAVVGQAGAWTAVFTASQVSQLGNTTHTLHASVSDAAGNAAPAGTRTFKIDRQAPSLSNPTADPTRNPALADSLLSLSEASNALTLRGTTSAEEGQQLDVRLGGLTQSAVIQNGDWQVEFSAADLATFEDGDLPLSLRISDVAGNLTSADYNIVLDRTAQVNLVPVSKDGWINIAESTEGLTLSGLVGSVEDGQTISVLVGSRAGSPSTPYTTQVFNGEFTLTVPAGDLAWSDGVTYEMTVSGEDRAGNPFSASRKVTADLTAPTLDLKLVIGDAAPVALSQYTGTLNAEAIAAGVSIGSAGSNDTTLTSVSVGATEGLLVAPKQTGSGTTWSIPLDPVRTNLAPEGTVSVSASAIDAAGNSASASANIKVDRAASISIDAPVDGAGGNNQINAAEAPALTLGGSVAHVQNGASVNVTVQQGDSTVLNTTTTVNNGLWSVATDGSAWVDGTYTVGASLVDSLGNPAGTSQKIQKNTAPPVFLKTAIAGDNVLNAAEAVAAVAPSLAGFTTNAEDGQLVSVTLPGAGSALGRTLTAAVEGGTWSVPLPADLLAAYAANNGAFTVNLSLGNLAGNTANSTLDFRVDTQTPTLTLNPISAAQAGTAALNPDTDTLSLSGTVQGLENEANQPVRLVVNGSELTAARESGNPSNWSLSLPKEVLKSLQATGNAVEIQVKDLADNLTSLMASFNATGVGTTPPVIAIPADRKVLADGADLLIRQFQANKPVSWSLTGIDDNLVRINPSTGSLSFLKPVERIQSNSAESEAPTLTLPFTVIATDARGNEKRETLTLIVSNLVDPGKLDPLDRDGISATVEDAATNGRAGTVAGDLNNDGIADRMQPNVAAVPWINQANFDAANADPTKAEPNSFASLQVGSGVRIANLDVRAPIEVAVPGNTSSKLPTQIATSTLGEGGPRLATITTPYDPLVFQLQSYDVLTQEALGAFVDIAPNVAGTQVRLSVDLPGDGLAINTYLKWNPTANNGAGSWMEFLADGNPDTFDNGAELVDLNGDGRIDRIVLTYTDGEAAGGDIDGLVNGIIDDPGMPALLEAAQGNGQSTTTVPVVTATGTRDVPILFYGGQLSPATNVKRESLEQLTNQSERDKLSAAHLTVNQEVIDFELTLNPGFKEAGLKEASVNTELSLVASDLTLSNAQGRIANRRLALYGTSASGALQSLTYNPVKKAGARFYDLDDDGVAEFLSLSLLDGDYGDKGATVDGKIMVSTTAATVDLDPQLTPNAKTWTVVDQANPTAPASMVVRVALNSRAGSANQIGYVVLETNEIGKEDELLADLTTLKSRAKTVFSNFEGSDVTLPTGAKFESDIVLQNGQGIRFFEVADSTLEEISKPADSRLKFLETTDTRLTLTFPAGDQGLNELISREQGTAPVLDFSAFSGTDTIKATVGIAREAGFNPIAGFYRALDAQGSVRAADGAILRPGDGGYAAAALRTDNLVTELAGFQVGNRQVSVTEITVSESTVLAPFARVNSDTFFAYGAANADGLSHFRSFGKNLIGLEDTRGGGDRDYDDLILQFSFSKGNT